ncbi:MAG: hypothetical protein KGN74_14700 [Gemmatimonadota bacterium]|nr:hypothetical protein [Gemmatimonadota bacterium]MDE3216625.1 hypothetical protein [Gemmatimonadota bacterium]
MRFLVWMVVAVSLLAARGGRAQTPVVLAPDTRIRFRLPPDQPPIEGAVIVQRGDSVWVRQRESAARVDFTLSSLVALEVQRGKRRNAGRGALIGLVAGAVTGAALGAAVGSDCTPNALVCFESAETIPLLGAYGAGVGAAVGALIGVFVQTDRWVRVPLPRGGTAALTRGGRAVVVRYAVF